MRIYEQNPQKTPHLFYLPRDTGEVDELGEPILAYDVEWEEETAAIGKRVKRRCKNGTQSHHVKTEEIDVYRDDVLVATWRIIPQYLGGGSKWRDFNKPLDNFVDVVDGHLVGSGTQGAFSWDIDIDCGMNGGKWTVNVVAPGQTVRAVWEIEIFDPTDLVINTDDYVGSIESDLPVGDDPLLAQTYTVTFEPAGSVDGIVIDPYFGVAETATTLTVTTDAAPFFEITFDEAKGGCIDVLYFGDGGSTNYSDSTALLNYFINDGSERLQSGISSTMAVVESTPNRVVARFAGDITTNVPMVHYVYIYPTGRIFFETILTNNTGGNITGTSGGLRLKTDATNYTNDVQYGDNSDDTTPTYNTEYWFGHVSSDAIDSIIVGIITADTEGQQDTYAESANSNEYRKDTVTWADGTTYAHKYVLLIDDDYYNATQATAETNIEAEISQYKDTTMTDPDPGNAVTDLNIPDAIGSSGFASDGAWHFEPESAKQIAWTWDRTRIAPNVVQHENEHFPASSGSTPDEHLIGYWKCDDNAASTTVVDATSKVGDMTATANTSTLTTSDSMQGNALQLDQGSSERLSITLPTSGDYDPANWKDNFTIKLKVKLNFAEAVGSYQYILAIYSSSTDRLMLFYNNSDDKLYLGNDIGNVGSNTAIHDFTGEGDAYVQLWRDVTLTVDITNNKISCKYGEFDEVINTTSTSWTADPTKIDVPGNSASAYGSIIVDNIKLYNERIYPYGAYLTYFDQLDDYDNAHSDITFYWHCSSTTLQIGTGGPVTVNGDYSTGVNGNGFRNDAAGEYASEQTASNIAASEGTLCFWFKPNSALGADCTLFYADSAFKVWWDDSDNDVAFTYNTDTINQTTAFAAGDTSWHFVRVGWKASDTLFIEVDGVRNELTSGVDAAPTLDATMFFTADDASGTNRANVIIDEFYITDNLNTPQHPTAFGKPLWAPVPDIA